MDILFEVLRIYDNPCILCDAVPLVLKQGLESIAMSWFPLFYCIQTKIQNTNTNTNNFILHRIENNKTLATSYFSKVNMYNIIQLFTITLT